MSNDSLFPDFPNLQLSASTSAKQLKQSSSDKSDQAKRFSVSELTALIKKTLEEQVAEVSVEGEISNFRQQSSGHLYFTLKDAGAQLAVVMFRGEAMRLGFMPRDGLQVIARGEITVYAARGNYQLRAFSLQSKGKGSLQEQFEALKRKLAAEGLFDSERKKQIPLFPQKIGIITSPTGAVLHDFLQILTRRCPRIELHIFGVQVQGNSAAKEIVHALEEFNRRGEVDVIVLARGGGSLEDLWAFNEEALARAVASSDIPTISAVGHEIDFTICDFVADLRAPTPSAAAELVSRSDDEWLEALNIFFYKLQRNASSHLNALYLNWQRLAAHSIFRQPQHMIQDWFQTLDEKQLWLGKLLQMNMGRKQEKYRALELHWARLHPEYKFTQLRQKLDHHSQRLRLLSPQATLERGYAMVLNQEGKLLSSAQSARKAEAVHVRFADDTVPMRVEKSLPST